MSTNNGGPAFPVPEVFDERRGETTQYGSDGMTLRDYFAAKALAGFLAHPEQDYAPLIDDKAPMLASESYRLADAMLKARES